VPLTPRLMRKQGRRYVAGHFFPSTDVRYDFISREWFVPFNLEVGKVWNKSFLTGLEIGVPFFETAHPVYKYKIEAHVGFRF